MKRLNTSFITSTTEQPIKSGTLDFIQDSYKDMFANIFSSIVENPNPATIYIVSGCKNSGAGSVYNISAGVLFYNGEFYNFDGASFTLTGLQKAYARIVTTYYSVNADPVTFTDGIQRNVHEIRKIVVENTITSSGLPEFKDFVSAGIWMKYDVKQIDCPTAYISANFDGTGLGINERVGWAICNGNNGTQNRKGRVAVGYDSVNYPTLGATGGESTHLLDITEIPSHSHSVAYDSHNASAGGSEWTLDNGGGASGTTTTGASGGGLAHNNMQPYIVTLFIQKI